MRSGKPLGVGIDSVGPDGVGPPYEARNVQLDYDRYDWSSIIDDVFGRFPFTLAGSNLVPPWVNVVIEATYYGKGDVLSESRMSRKPGQKEHSKCRRLLRRRGKRFLLSLKRDQQLRSAVMSTYALSGPAAVADLLEVQACLS